MDFSKIDKLARKGDAILEIEKPLLVKSPWHLAWQSIENGNFNVLYSPYVAREEQDLPTIIFYDISEPFWDLEGKDWRVFKKRCVGYTKQVEGINGVEKEDLERTKIQVLGGKNYDGNWLKLPCVLKLKKMKKGRKYLEEAKRRNKGGKEIVWNCEAIRSIISEEGPVPCGRCPIA